MTFQRDGFQIFEGGLTAIRVGEVRRVVVASPDYVATHGEPRRPGELSRHAVLFVATRPIPREWRFREAGRDRIVKTGAIREFARRMPHATYVEIADAEHEILMENDQVRGRFWSAFDSFVEEYFRSA